MARKKKTETLKVTEVNPIIYSGQVTIKKIKKGKVISTQKIHNEGTNHLFKFLLNCLAGNWIPSARPSWICTGQYTNSGQVVIKYVADTCSKITQQPEVFETSSDVYIQYKFLLQSKPQYTTTGFNCLLLYSDDNKPVVVQDGVEVDPSYSMVVNFDTQHQSADEQILIIWQLKILNPNT